MTLRLKTALSSTSYKHEITLNASVLSQWIRLEVIYFAMRGGRRLPWAGRAGRRLNDKESLMVHWGRPTTPAMARQHKLQLALLLEMDKKDSAQHRVEMIVGLLPG